MKFILIEKVKKDKFLTLFQLIKLSTQYIHFSFEEERIFIQGMNKSHSCLFEIYFDYDWFDYIEKDVISFSIESNIFSSILSISSENQFLIIEYILDNEKLFLSYINNKEIISYIPNYTFTESTHYNKYFEIVLIEMEYETLDIPELEYDAEMCICPKIWNELLSQMSIFAEKIMIKCNEEQIELHSIGDQGEIKINIPIDNIQEYSINEGEEMNMCFSLNLLSKLSLSTKLSSSLYMNFKKNYPLQLKYIFDNNTLIFYISYMIEND
jgi:proliferating cell nuclear antigen